MGERYKGDLEIVAAIIGGTAPIHNFIVGICIIFVFFIVVCCNNFHSVHARACDL